MQLHKISVLLASFLLFIYSCSSPQKNAETSREIWSKEKANEWYDNQGWLVGSNFISSTAINQLEMWQAETFDTLTIDRELGWAASLGMNTARVYLHDLLHEQDSLGFYQRIDTFLKIADRHQIRIRPMNYIFDS